MFSTMVAQMELYRINIMKNIYKCLLYLLVGVLSLSACKDNAFESAENSDDPKIEPVLFTTMVPDVSHKTRSKEEWENEVKSYKAVQKDYTFTVEMWKEGASSAFQSSTYKPISSTNDQDEVTYEEDGTLQIADDATPLYWQDNVNKWGFKATAGTLSLEADQTTQEKWLDQDLLIGYSYLPIWKDDNANADENYNGEDDFNAINYRTNKEWYADNKTAKDLSGLMANPNSDDYKKIPLFMQHQRAWVTIILKAGEGVTREALAYATSANKIKANIYSYKEGETTALPIDALSSEFLINYEHDKNGYAATDVSTTRYDAIVEPHNFIADRTTEETDIIARINVSDQNFSFSAANDFNYERYIADGATDEEKEKMNVYNLSAGKHLTITATLSRKSRMIKITAWIEDWTETVTQTICDDYGQNGDPYLIENREKLIEFLNDRNKNRAGNVAMIVPNTMSLVDTEGTTPWGDYTLRATLNLASSQLSIGKQLLNNIERTGSIINGELRVVDSFADKTAIANYNEGTIERVRITTSSETSPARASIAGLVDTNYGTIFQCSSALTVFGDETSQYVGGIAGKNLYKVANMLPVIDACTVSARVDGVTSVTAGGGIVGLADGRVSNNTFEYGITLLQDSKFQNIIGAIGAEHDLTMHSNNAWPTTDKYTVPGSEVVIVNRNTSSTFDAIIDSRDELKTLLTSGYNQANKTYRVANSFSVDKENWIWGNNVLYDTYFDVASTGEYANGTVKFNLDGNDKTITLTGEQNATMLFGAIIGNVHDLNLYLDKPIIADRITNLNGIEGDSNTDAIAAFCYSVTGTGTVFGTISNISLKAKETTTVSESGSIIEKAYIQSTTPAGIAVWASHGGTLTNCVSNVPVRMEITTDGTDARHYAGGIVACAEKASITQCKYYGGSGSISWTDNKAAKGNCRYGGVVGGTSEIAQSSNTPSLQLSDCYSWWDLPKFEDDVIVRPVMGSIIGSTIYHDQTSGDKLFNAMAEENAGNWWTGTTGAGLMLSGVSEEKAIGKKNTVTPTKPTGW